MPYFWNMKTNELVFFFISWFHHMNKLFCFWSEEWVYFNIFFADQVEAILLLRQTVTEKKSFEKTLRILTPFLWICNILLDFLLHTITLCGGINVIRYLHNFLNASDFIVISFFWSLSDTWIGLAQKTESIWFQIFQIHGRFFGFLKIAQSGAKVLHVIHISGLKGIVFDHFYWNMFFAIPGINFRYFF